MNDKKLNKLTKKYIEIVTKDFDKPFNKKKSKNENNIESINQDGGGENKIQNIISINDILKVKKI